MLRDIASLLLLHITIMFMAVIKISPLEVLCKYLAFRICMFFFAAQEIKRRSTTLEANFFFSIYIYFFSSEEKK